MTSTQNEIYYEKPELYIFNKNNYSTIIETFVIKFLNVFNVI